ncbi:hypothetical protein Tco_0305868 [Tanacetum coccineum]
MVCVIKHIPPQFFFNKDLDYLLTGDKKQKIALSISKLKVARYLDFGLKELVPSLWVESEREYDISAVYGITHWWSSHEVSVSTEGVEELKRIVKIKGVKKEALHSLRLTLKIDIMDPVMQCPTLPSHSESFKRFLFHFSRRLNTLSIETFSVRVS